MEYGLLLWRFLRLTLFLIANILTMTDYLNAAIGMNEAVSVPVVVDVDKMHDLLYKRGFTIYPGKIGKKGTFRLANMGAIDHKDIKNFLKTLKEVIMQEMNLKLK